MHPVPAYRLAFGMGSVRGQPKGPPWSKMWPCKRTSPEVVFLGINLGSFPPQRFPEIKFQNKRQNTRFLLGWSNSSSQFQHMRSIVLVVCFFCGRLLLRLPRLEPARPHPTALCAGRSWSDGFLDVKESPCHSHRFWESLRGSYG